MKSSIKNLVALASKFGNDESEQLSVEDANKLEGGKGVDFGCSIMRDHGCGPNIGCESKIATG